MNRLFILLSLLLSLSFSIKAQENNSETKLTGQFVCSECWFEEDRKKVAYGNEADIACAKACAKKGIPSALAVTDEKGDATLYIVEKGKFVLKGKDWLEYTAKRVEITGNVREENGKHFIKVNSLTVLENADEKIDDSKEAELILKDMSGIEQRLSAFRGRVVVLNFWATWCLPCKEEMPDLAKIQNDYAALGVQVIGASGDTQDERAKVLQFVQKNKINFPVWLGATTDNMQAFNLGKALPATVIIGRDGRIVHRIRGIIKAKELRAQLDKLFAVDVAENSSPKTKEEVRSSSVPA